MTGAPAQRVAVVTGGTTGIGFATVEALLDADFLVAFFGQNAAHVEQARSALSSRFDASRFLARRVDLTQAGQVAEFFQSVGETWSLPDTLICNAGISPKGETGATPFEELGLAEWNEVLSVNLTGAMVCCQAVLPGMGERGFGRIVLIGSIAGRTLPKIAGTAYTVSKAGMSGLSRALVAETAGTGVTVNIVAPGRIVTGMTGDAHSAVNAEACARIPAGRLGRPGDVSSLIRFLVSGEAGFINGAIIDVNGGEFAPL